LEAGSVNVTQEMEKRVEELERRLPQVVLEV
jgi:electron transfer flavoprotein alpha/beta subunit